MATPAHLSLVREGASFAGLTDHGDPEITGSCSVEIMMPFGSVTYSVPCTRLPSHLTIAFEYTQALVGLPVCELQIRRERQHSGT